VASVVYSELAPVRRQLIRGWWSPIGTAPRAGVLAISVLPAWRGKGIGQTLLASMYAELEDLGYDHGLYYYVNEANTKSRRLAESFGGQGRVLYHCYDKALT
jgi:L-amino acid N-acyltransferase YncA